MTGLAIEVKGLTKSYGPVEAVGGIDLDVARGEVFALLGPNGAGKTTTVEILEGHRQRSAGEVSVLGFDPARAQRDYKQRIGIVLQDTGVDRYLTVEEVIDLYRGFYPSPRPVGEVIELVGLTEKRKERVIRLSGGQQRRLDVAVGLAGDPELLFLDEPTTGFDPSARRQAWQMVKNLQELGKTVFLTTHYMDEAQYLADRVAVIVAGKIVADGPPGSLGGRDVAGSTITFTLRPDAARLPPEFMSAFGATGATFRAETTDPVALLNRLTTWALENRVALGSLNVAQPTLEDVYLRLAGDAAEVPKDPETEDPRRGRRRRARA